METAGKSEGHSAPKQRRGIKLFGKKTYCDARRCRGVGVWCVGASCDVPRALGTGRVGVCVQFLAINIIIIYTLGSGRS
mgnify:FL=1